MGGCASKPNTLDDSEVIQSKMVQEVAQMELAQKRKLAEYQILRLLSLVQEVGRYYRDVERVEVHKVENRSSFILMQLNLMMLQIAETPIPNKEIQLEDKIDKLLNEEVDVSKFLNMLYDSVTDEMLKSYDRGKEFEVLELHNRSLCGP